jgi:hypothetical protein
VHIAWDAPCAISATGKQNLWILMERGSVG